VTPFQRTTDAALRFSPPGHFYSPHPRLKDLEAERVDGRQRPEQAAGIDLNTEEQLSVLRRAEELRPAGPWLIDQHESLRFYYNNAFFRFGDSNAIWQIASPTTFPKIIV